MSQNQCDHLYSLCFTLVNRIGTDQGDSPFPIPSHPPISPLSSSPSPDLSTNATPPVGADTNSQPSTPPATPTLLNQSHLTKLRNQKLTSLVSTLLISTVLPTNSFNASSCSLTDKSSLTCILPNKFAISSSKPPHQSLPLPRWPLLTSIFSRTRRWYEPSIHGRSLGDPNWHSNPFRIFPHLSC